MISHVICEHSLPFPKDNLEEEDVLEFNSVEWGEHVFNSFSSLGDTMILGAIDKYTITEDGHLYKDMVEQELDRNASGELEIKEVDNGIEKQEFTGEILFHTIFFGAKHDYWLEFKALFWKGDMKELELGSSEKHPNKGRLEAQKAVSDELSKYEEEKQGRCKKVLGPVVLFFTFFIKFFLGLVAKIIFKIERWTKIR